MAGLFDIFSGSDANNAAATQAQYLASGDTQLNNFVNSGTQNLQQLYGAALAPYTQNYAATTQGQNQLGNLLGLNGASGNASAQNTLQNLPGYQFALNQGAQNVMRNQSATGQLNSGATNLDLQAQGQGLANQNYFNYANQLQPYLGAANNAAGGIAGVNTGLGNQINQNLNTEGAAAYGTLAGQGNAYANADYANLAASGALFGGLTSLAGNVLGAGLKPGSGPASGNSSGSFFGNIFSDENLKEDIIPDGKYPNGMNRYKYRYRGGKKMRSGLLAQEVEKIKPEAVTKRGPFKQVNYRLALKD